MSKSAELSDSERRCARPAADALYALVRLLARQAAAEAVRDTTGTDEKPGSGAAAEPAG